jgi:hypothetical protein
VAEPKLAANPRFLALQKKRLAKKYDSYWYSMVKGEWTKNDGWPVVADWPKLQAWIVRKKLSEVRRNARIAHHRHSQNLPRPISAPEVHLTLNQNGNVAAQGGFRPRLFYSALRGRKCVGEAREGRSLTAASQTKGFLASLG